MFSCNGRTINSQYEMIWYDMEVRIFMYFQKLSTACSRQLVFLFQLPSEFFVVIQSLISDFVGLNDL